MEECLVLKKSGLFLLSSSGYRTFKGQISGNETVWLYYVIRDTWVLFIEKALVDLVFVV